LTQNFVGTLRVGYNCPTPMPGVHGGGDPAKAFARLRDFYYLRLAQARFAESKTPPPSTLRLWASRVGPMTKLATLLASFCALAFRLLVTSERPRRFPPHRCRCCCRRSCPLPSASADGAPAVS
jgi:hypothetical protein